MLFSILSNSFQNSNSLTQQESWLFIVGVRRQFTAHTSSTIKHHLATCKGYQLRCSNCLKAEEKLEFNGTGHDGNLKHEFRFFQFSSLPLQLGRFSSLMLSCFTSLKETKTINGHEFGNETSEIRLSISSLILHQFANFDYPNDPLNLLFQMVQVVFKFIEK